MDSWTLTRMALGATCLHAILFLLLHFLEPGVDPASGLISDYAQTSSAPLATTAFLAFGLTWGALSVALGAIAGRPTVQVGRALFALAALAIVVAALLPATADPRTGSVLARLQNLLARPGLFLGVILISLGIRHAPETRTTGRLLVGVAIAATVLLLVTLALLLNLGLGGTGQRAIFVLLYIWVWLLGFRVLRPAARPRMLSNSA